MAGVRASPITSDHFNQMAWLENLHLFLSNFLQRRRSLLSSSWTPSAQKPLRKGEAGAGSFAIRGWAGALLGSGSLRQCGDIEAALAGAACLLKQALGRHGALQAWHGSAHGRIYLRASFSSTCHHPFRLSHAAAAAGGGQETPTGRFEASFRVLTLERRALMGASSSLPCQDSRQRLPESFTNSTQLCQMETGSEQTGSWVTNFIKHTGGQAECSGRGRHRLPT